MWRIKRRQKKRTRKLVWRNCFGLVIWNYCCLNLGKSIQLRDSIIRSNLILNVSTCCVCSFDVRWKLILMLNRDYCNATSQSHTNKRKRRNWYWYASAYLQCDMPVLVLCILNSSFGNVKQQKKKKCFSKIMSIEALSEIIWWK